jgi:hypothetical protein
MGYLSTLQRSSRSAAGQPIHIRMDGPGFDSLDVPGGRISSSRPAATALSRSLSSVVAAEEPPAWSLRLRQACES